jgi:hypothetical protein
VSARCSSARFPASTSRIPSGPQLFEDLRRAGLLKFARADLVAAMDPELVATSEWRLDGTTYHFLQVA